MTLSCSAEVLHGYVLQVWQVVLFEVKTNKLRCKICRDYRLKWCEKYQSAVGLLNTLLFI